MKLVFEFADGEDSWDLPAPTGWGTHVPRVGDTVHLDVISRDVADYKVLDVVWAPWGSEAIVTTHVRVLLDKVD